MKYINYKSYIFILILLSLASRIFAFYFVSDLNLVNEWRVLIHNLDISGTLGYNVVIDEFYALPKLATKTDLVLPSVFMPPFYAFFLYVIQLIFSSSLNFINIIIGIQICLSVFSVYIFFKTIQLTENNKVSFLFALIFSLIPINIYSSVQISSISIQVFFLSYFFYILRSYSLKKKISLYWLLIFSFLSGLLILLRGEFFLFYFFYLIYFFLIFSKNLKALFISLIITSLIISPYIIRNYNNFNTFVITKSFGYNLLKGNNPSFKVEGNPSFIEEKFNRKNLNIKTDSLYEINLDNFYKNKAIEYIKNDKTYYLQNYLKKVFSFVFLDINSSYQNYYNILHIGPKILLSTFSLLGGLLVLRRKGFLQYISLYFFFNIFFFSIFFILPRYSLILLSVQILLSLEFIKILFRKLFD